MLELLISVLLAFGFSFDDQGQLVGSSSVSKDQVYQEVKQNADYQTLGGDDALYSIVVTDGADPQR